MGALIWRDLTVITRTPAFWVSAALYVAVLTAFVVVWGDGVPVVGAQSNWEQFTMAQRVLLAVLLPWTAARCSASSRRELVWLGAISGQRPWVLLLAKYAALAAALLALALSALPMIVLMQQIGAASTTTAALDMAPVAALALFVAGVTTAMTVVLEAPIRVWAVTGGVTLISAIFGPPAPRVALLWLAVFGTVAALCVLAMRSTLTYLPEEGA